MSTYFLLGFPGGSDGRESAYNVGDLGSIPGLGRSPNGGHANPLQYSCLENPHRGAWLTAVSLSFPCGSVGKESACNVGDLGWEDPLEKGKATHSSILA